MLASGAGWAKQYVMEHGSGSLGFSIGAGLAIDVEVGVSTKGITIFGGLGAGFGVSFSASANYDFQDIVGFTSRSSVNAAFGAVPVQFGGSFMISESGPAFSLGVQSGEGLEIESVVGYTKTYTWDDINKDIQRRMRY